MFRLTLAKWMGMCAMVAGSLTAVGARDDGKPSEEILKPAEKAAVVGALKEYLDFLADDAASDKDTEKKRSDLYSDLERKLEKAEKASGGESILKHPAYLAQLIQESQPKKDAPYKGRVLDKQKGDLKLHGRKVEAEYAYFVPKEYNAKNSYPLILGCAPQGLSAQKYIDTVWKDAGFREKYVLVAAALPQGEAWFSETGRLKLLAIVLRRALDDFNIDTDRIFVDGLAESGEDVLRLAGFYADLFAGVIVRSVNAVDVSPVNFRNLPVWIAYAPDDTKVKGDALEKLVEQMRALKIDVSVEKVAGREHGACVEASPKLLAWLENKRRQVMTPEIQWSVPDPMADRAYWLQIAKMETGKNVVADFTARVTRATGDKEKNRIEITSKNVYEFRVMLNDDIVDLDRPIEVVANGQTVFNGKKDRSLRHALDQLYRSGDPARAFPASLQFPVSH